MRYEEYDSLIMGEENAICYIVDCETYEMLHLTKRGMELYKLRVPEDYLGKKCYRLLQGQDKPCSFCTNGMLKQGEKYCWEHFNEKLQRWMDIQDTLIEIDGRLCRLEHARDITLQKERMQRLADQLTVEEILVECIQILAKEDDFDVAFQRFLERLGRFYRANRAYIFEFDWENGVTHNTYEWCAPGVSAEIEKLQGIPLEYISDWITKFKKAGEFFITSLGQNVSKDSEEYRILEAQGIESLLAAPLWTGGEIAGFIGVDDPENSTEDLTLLRASSDFVIEELKKRRLINRLVYVSYTDMLTETNNRNRYTEVLQQYENEPPERMGVIFVDVNGMKEINDSKGHKYGDRLLVKVAGLLRKMAEHHVYRIGGDEFVVLYENIERAQFEEKAAELKRAAAEEEDCDVSIGCAWESGTVDVNQLITRADHLMYEEKKVYYRKQAR